MTWYWFPDNTVLCNFAAVSRLRLLKEILRGRGRWVEAIYYEATNSARFYPELASIGRDGWLGEPIQIRDQAEVDLIEQVRRSVFGGSRQRPTEHLGEAQTCHVILNWPAFQGSFWVTDDRDALEYARRRGITTRDTMDLFCEATVEGLCTQDEAYKLLHEMARLGRHLRLPNRPEDIR
ncbi:hypothetical protein GCM10010106_40740 [Thermopolyspora flexuosa]|jgi:predicted nucleic acid-binding protein|uniref:Putative nucleic acid-binding protein n=1 Tax=Thermopolyspora flexuosa TaxID=103836 RepID=A0A543IUE1_9ACTN|nr:hypothetical protein [Thermopolyspora flexuosa]PZN18143.1 MAG: hypothetical protein DIU75_17700 [Mycolicibacterium hassiacum]TQM74185.1 putative nucleic acid-binding protein [Thermopolyspora flexuosa]GGM89237.1 hypothetical protein GCM10010106_40740 [Thermopolyspora flexuosa]